MSKINEFNQFSTQIWNKYDGNHQHRVDVITQNSKLDTHVEDSHYVEHSVDPAVVYKYYLVYD